MTVTVIVGSKHKSRTSSLAGMWDDPTSVSRGPPSGLGTEVGEQGGGGVQRLTSERSQKPQESYIAQESTEYSGPVRGCGRDSLFWRQIWLCPKLSFSNHCLFL